MTKLTHKQKLFVQYYCQHWNATKAALQAGYSEHGARQQAAETLAKPYIKVEIEKSLNEIMGKAKIDAESIVHELGEIAFSNPDDKNTVIKFSDKLKALELLGRYHQMFVDRVETVTIDQVFTAITNRPESSPKHAIKH